MRNLKHAFTYSRGYCFVHRSEDFPYPFRGTTGDFVKTTDPVIK